MDCTVTITAFPFVNVTVETKPLPNAVDCGELAEIIAPAQVYLKLYTVLGI